MQHHVTDEDGQPWVVDDEDYGGQLWRAMPWLPDNDIIVPRHLIAPTAPPTIGQIGTPLKYLKHTDAMKDETMGAMVKAQIYLTIKEVYDK